MFIFFLRSASTCASTEDVVEQDEKIQKGSGRDTKSWKKVEDRRSWGRSSAQADRSIFEIEQSEDTWDPVTGRVFDPKSSPTLHCRRGGDNRPVMHLAQIFQTGGFRKKFKIAQKLLFVKKSNEFTKISCTEKCWLWNKKWERVLYSRWDESRERAPLARWPDALRMRNPVCDEPMKAWGTGQSTSIALWGRRWFF